MRRHQGNRRPFVPIFIRVEALLLAVVVVFSTAALAEEKVTHTLDGKAIYQYTGDDISMDQVVWGFFEYVEALGLPRLDGAAPQTPDHGDDGNLPKSWPLADLELKPGDPAFEILTRYTVEAGSLDQATLQNWPRTAAEYDAERAMWLGLVAERRGLLFGSMVIELDNIGYDLGLLQQFLSDQIRPGVSAVAGGAPRSRKIVEERSRFDEAFQRALDRAGVIW